MDEYSIASMLEQNLLGQPLDSVIKALEVIRARADEKAIEVIRARAELVKPIDDQVAQVEQTLLQVEQTLLQVEDERNRYNETIRALKEHKENVLIANGHVKNY